MVACPICGKEFSKRGMVGHLAWKHGSSRPKGGQARLEAKPSEMLVPELICPYCGTHSLPFTLRGTGESQIWCCDRLLWRGGNK